MSETLLLPSPVEQIFEDILFENNVELFIKRDDLIHPNISGNKWRKLKLNIEHALNKKQSEIVTFGGAFSNHIHATAFACKLFKIKCTAYIRGTYVDINNPTLSKAREWGAKIIPTEKKNYKIWSRLEAYHQLRENHPNALFIPEGGNSLLGQNGMEYLAAELLEDLPNNQLSITLPVGTGCTIRGLRSYLPKHIHVAGFNVLNYNLFISKTSIYNDYHFGGYAKVNKKLIEFINSFKDKHNIQLDPIYTGKMMFGLFQEISKGTFSKNSTIVAIHTGGLQGIEAFNLKAEQKSELLISV